MKPGPAQNLWMEGLLSNGLTFSYEIPRQMRHFPPGLIQHIEFRNQWSDEWTVVDTSAWNLEVCLVWKHKTNIEQIIDRITHSHIIWRT